MNQDPLDLATKTLWADWSPSSWDDETRARVNDAMQLLPAAERDCLELHLQGSRQRDIAAVLGCSQGAISYRLRRARMRLQWHLSRPPRPWTLEADIEKASPGDLSLILELDSLRSQLAVSRKLGVTQGYIYGRWSRVLRNLQRAGLSESYAYLAYLNGSWGVASLGSQWRPGAHPLGSGKLSGAE